MSYRGHYPTRFRRSGSYKKPFVNKGGSPFKFHLSDRGYRHRGHRGNFSHNEHFDNEEMELQDEFANYRERGRERERVHSKRFVGRNVRSFRSRFLRGRNFYRGKNNNSFRNIDDRFSPEISRYPPECIDEIAEDFINLSDDGEWSNRRLTKRWPHNYEDVDFIENEERPFHRKAESPIIIHRKFEKETCGSRNQSPHSRVFRNFTGNNLQNSRESLFEGRERSPLSMHSRSPSRRDVLDNLPLHFEKRPFSQLSNRSRRDYRYEYQINSDYLPERRPMSGLSRHSGSFERISFQNRSRSRSPRSFRSRSYDRAQFPEPESRILNRYTRSSRSISLEKDSCQRSQDIFFERSKLSKPTSSRSVSYDKCSDKSYRRPREQFSNYRRHERSSFIGSETRSFERRSRSPFISKYKSSENFDRRSRTKSFDRSRSSLRKEESIKVCSQDFDLPSRSISPNRREVGLERRRNRYKSPGRYSKSSSVHSNSKPIIFEQNDSVSRHRKRFHEKRSESSIERFLDDCKKSVERRQDHSISSSRHHQESIERENESVQRSFSPIKAQRKFKGLEHITIERGNSFERSLSPGNSCGYSSSFEVLYNSQISPPEQFKGNKRRKDSVDRKLEDLYTTQKVREDVLEHFASYRQKSYDRRSVSSSVDLDELYKKNNLVQDEHKFISTDGYCSFKDRQLSEKMIKGHGFNKQSSFSPIPKFKEENEEFSMNLQTSKNKPLRKRSSSNDSMQKFLAELEKSHDKSSLSSEKSIKSKGSKSSKMYLKNTIPVGYKIFHSENNDIVPQTSYSQKNDSTDKTKAVFYNQTQTNFNLDNERENLFDAYSKTTFENFKNPIKSIGDERKQTFRMYHPNRHFQLIQPQNQNERTVGNQNQSSSIVNYQNRSVAVPQLSEILSAKTPLSQEFVKQNKATDLRTTSVAPLSVERQNLFNMQMPARGSQSINDNQWGTNNKSNSMSLQNQQTCAHYKQHDEQGTFKTNQSTSRQQLTTVISYQNLQFDGSNLVTSYSGISNIPNQMASVGSNYNVSNKYSPFIDKERKKQPMQLFSNSMASFDSNPMWSNKQTISNQNSSATKQSFSTFNQWNQISSCKQKVGFSKQYFNQKSANLSNLKTVFQYSFGQSDQNTSVQKNFEATSIQNKLDQSCTSMQHVLQPLKLTPTCVDLTKYLTGIFGANYLMKLNSSRDQIIVIDDDDDDGSDTTSDLKKVRQVVPDPLFLKNPPSFEDLEKMFNGFVIYFGVKRDSDLQKDPFLVIQESFSRSERFGFLDVEERKESEDFLPLPKQTCILRWNGVMLAKASASSFAEACQKASISLINMLARVCYTVQIKYSYSCGGKLPKFMLKKKEVPGVYKLVEREELIKAVTDTLKSLKETGAYTGKGVDATSVKIVIEFIDNFFKNKNTFTELFFGGKGALECTLGEHKQIQNHVEKLKWLEWRTISGFGRGMYTAVCRKRTPQDICRYLLGAGGESVRYKLIPPQGQWINLLTDSAQYSPNIKQFPPRESQVPEQHIYSQPPPPGTTEFDEDFESSGPSKRSLSNETDDVASKRGKWE